MSSAASHLRWPIFGLAGIVLAGMAFEVSVMQLGGEPSGGAATLFNASFALAVAWAVELDRRARGISAPFEYGAFMFFLWWFLLPAYLYRTRRGKGILIALGVFLAALAPYLAAVGTYFATQ